MPASLKHNMILLAGLVAVAWLIGLVIFVQSVAKMEETPPAALAAQADVIVVLTGGSERIAAGLELLRAGKGKQLLISGVHPGLSLDRLIGNAIGGAPGGQPLPKDLRARIALGHAADTIENANETKAYMEAGPYASMLLVTSNYHMARSLLELRAAMPGTAIIPYPVASDKVKLGEWFIRPGTAGLMVTEYVKYLLAALRIQLGAA